MSRPVSGEVKVGIFKQKQKNGDIYVFERRTLYDPNLGYAKTLGTKLLGKIPKGQKEMIPTRPKRQISEKEGSFAIGEQVGSTNIFEWIGSESGIDADLHRAFDESTANKVITIARFWLANPDASLSRLWKWQTTRSTPYEDLCYREDCQKLFSDIAWDKTAVDQYFRLRSERSGKGDILAVDTTISPYQENLSSIRQNFENEENGFDSIKLLTIFSLKSRQPIAYTQQFGEISDVIRVGNVPKQFDWLDYSGVELVTDSGFCSDENIRSYLTYHVKFLTPVPISREWVRKEIDAHWDELDTFSSLCPWDLGIHGITVPIKKEFPRANQQTRNDGKTEDIQNHSYRLYLHLYLNRADEARDEERLGGKIIALKEKVLKQKGMNFSEKEQREIQKYLVLSKEGKAGTLQVSFKDEAFLEEKKYFGFFALVSNKATDAFEALKIYRLREKFEEGFRNQKDTEELGTGRIQYDDNLNGRLFCQFVALGYSLYWRYALFDLLEDLQTTVAKVSEVERDKRKILQNWLKANSSTDILDWMDCIEHAKLMGHRASQIISETAERDQLFFRLLMANKNQTD